MKKQFQLLMCGGIMAGAIMSSCKTADSVVLYDANAHPNKVYRASGSNATTVTTNRASTSSASVCTASKNDLPPVYEVQAVQNCPYSNAPAPAPAAQYMPQVVDMTAQSNAQPARYNQPAYQNYGGYNSTQVYNTRRASSNQYTNGRNKALDNNLYDRPTAYTLSEDMYTPEYRAMVNGRQNRAYNVQTTQNDPYTGLMTLQNGNVVPYNSQPQVIVQQQYYAQPDYQQPQPQQYVVPAQPQQQYYAESQNVVVDAYGYLQNEVRQADASYPATLFFKNGAKLTGTLVKIDNSACMFRMAEGRMVNFATKDILRIERR